MPWHSLGTCIVAEEGLEEQFGSFLFDAECRVIDSTDGQGGPGDRGDNGVDSTDF